MLSILTKKQLSHLSSAKLRATEQHLVSQLAAFGFEVKYHSGRSNKNPLSRKHPFEPQNLEAMVPGSSLPLHLWQALQLDNTTANQTAIAALPHHAPSDLWALQHADPVLQEVLVFWGQKYCPTLGSGNTYPCLHLPLFANGSDWCSFPSSLLSWWCWIGAATRSVTEGGIGSGSPGGWSSRRGENIGAPAVEVLLARYDSRGNQVVQKVREVSRLKGDTSAALSFMGHLLASRPNKILNWFHFVGTPPGKCPCFDWRIKSPWQFQLGITKLPQWHRFFWLCRVFESAWERLQVAAEGRKDNYDCRVRDAPLEVGKLVWFARS